MNRPRRTQKRANEAPAPAPTAAKKRRGGAAPAATGRRGRPRATVAEPETEEDPNDFQLEDVDEAPSSQPEPYDPRKSNVVASRRGAPVPIDTESVVSIATLQQPGTQTYHEDNSEEEEDDRVGDSMRQVRQLSVPDLSREARQLLTQLEAPERQNLVWKRLFMLRERAFLATREVFEQPVGFPFIDGDQLQDFGQHTGQGQLILGQANLASALDIIEGLQSGEVENVRDRIAELDDFSHKFFNPFGDEAKDLSLSLNIRTLRFIEELATQKPKANINPVLASIFCEGFEKSGKTDYPHLFTHGPLRELGHREDELVADATHDRIMYILEISKKDKKGNGLKLLREAFLQEKILGEFREWILKTYRQSMAVVEATQFQTAPGVHDVYFDASEQLRQEDTQSQSQSQSQYETQIQRFGDPQGASLFKGKESLQQFGDVINRRRTAPPSNQQNLRNDNIIGDRPLTATSGSPYPPFTNEGIMGSGYAPVHPYQARAQLNNDDDDEEDAFQQDNRQVNAQRSAAISHNLQQSRPPAPSSSMPPPPLPPSSTAQSTSHFQALKEEKRLLTQQARALAAATGSAPPSSSASSTTTTTTTNLAKQRHPWTDHDCQVLLELINTRQAGWSIMEASDKNRFEYPRNQQAYRDKARNMKVDYLMTNAVLPPNFNLVALGKKEIERLLSYGKNPYRREEDVDSEGNAINTEKRMIP